MGSKMGSILGLYRGYIGFYGNEKGNYYRV